MIYLRVGGGKDVIALYQAFGCHADRPAVEIHDWESSITVTVYGHSGFKELVAAQDGSIIFREMPDDGRKITSTTLSAGGQITLTRQKRSKYGGFAAPKNRRVSARSGDLIRQQIKARAMAVLPLARQLMTPRPGPALRIAPSFWETLHLEADMAEMEGHPEKAARFRMQAEQEIAEHHRRMQKHLGWLVFKHSVLNPWCRENLRHARAPRP